MDVSHKKQSLLFQELLKLNQPTTSYQLSFVIGVSIRTVKTYITLMNQQLTPYDICIKSKAGEGYWLEFGENAQLEKAKKIFDQELQDSFEEIPKYNYERINYIIKKLLVVDFHVKLEDLMDEIYVSRSTLTQDLKEVRKLLKKFRLVLVSRANYGIIIEGSEIDKRLCISEYFFHYNQKANYTIESENMINTGKNKEEYNHILNYLKLVCEEYSCILSDFSLNNLAIHISIGMRRCTFYNYIKVEDEIINTYKDTIEFRAATALIKKLEHEFHCMLPIGETIYYAMHLESKRISEQSNITQQERSLLEECISIMLAEVKNNFELNLDDDNELYQYLYSHIPQMIRRLKNHMVIRNPLVYDNLRRYLFATKVTHSACEVISNFYHVEVDIDEFGYLVLYFNLAITKYENRKRIKIGFVSGRGRPESIMYFNEIQEFLSHERYVFQLVDMEDIQSNKIKLDFIITTYTLPQDIKIKSYLIQCDTYLEEIRIQLNHQLYHTLQFNKYFKEEFSSFNLSGSTKEEVLLNFYRLLNERGHLKKIPDTCDLFKDNELGNGIVHFQDLYRICRSEMCFVAVLNRPILWDQDIVRVLIFTKTKRDGDKDLPTLCRFVSRWANRNDKVERLIVSKDYTMFLEDMMED